MVNRRIVFQNIDYVFHKALGYVVVKFPILVPLFQLFIFAVALTSNDIIYHYALKAL